jgi:hypothetical protein
VLRLVERLGPALEPSERARLAGSLRIESPSAGSARVRVVLGDETRVLEGTCEELPLALAVVLAASRVPPPAAARPADEAPRRVGRSLGYPRGSPRASRLDAPRARRRVEVSGATPEVTGGPTLRVEGGLGAADSLVWWIQAGAFFAIDVIRISVAARVMLPHRQPLGEGSPAGAELSAYGGDVEGCLHPLEALGLCVGLEAGALLGVGYGLDEDRADVGLLFALRASVLAEIDPGGSPAPLVRLGLGGWLPVEPPSVRVDGVGAVYRPAPAALAFVEGALEVR